MQLLPTRLSAKLSLDEIERALADELSLEEFEALEFAVTYNPTAGLYSDLLEAAVQELNLDSTSFWQFLLGVEPMPQPFQSLLEEITATVHEITLVEQQTLDNYVSFYKTQICQGKKVVLVAHSQGNLFGNEVFDSLTENEKASFGIVSVATPAHFVAGDDRFVGDNHTTLEEDLIIEAIRIAKFLVGAPLPMPANVNNLFSNLFDPLGHSFQKSYMFQPFGFDSNSRQKIVDDVVFLLDAVQGVDCGTPPRADMVVTQADTGAPPTAVLTALTASGWPGGNVAFFKQFGVTGEIGA